MSALREPQSCQRELLGDIQRLEKDDALGGQGLLVDVEAAVGRLEGVVPVGRLPAEVLGVDEAAGGAHAVGDKLRRLALVEAIAAIQDEALQGGGEVGLPQDLAGLVGPAVFHEDGAQGVAVDGWSGSICIAPESRTETGKPSSA